MGTRNRKLLFFLHYQRYLGLTNLDFSKSLHIYWLHGTWSSTAIQIVVVGVFMAALLGALAESLYYMETKSQTGNTFDNAVILTTSVTQLLANLWLRSQQKSQVNLLQRLSQVVELLQFEPYAVPQFRWLYRIWLLVCLIYGAMVTHFGINWLTTMQISRVLTLIGFVYRCVLANFQFTCYTGWC